YLFLENSFSQKFNNFNVAYLWIGFLMIGGIGLFAIWLVFFKFKHLPFSQKIIGFVQSFIEGLKTIATMKKKGWFIFHSIFIFFLYYAMIFVNFFAFDFTAGLSPLIGLSVFVMASLGMVAPVPGGIGAWHFMTFGTLAIYGVPINPSGAAFAFAVHGSMTLMLIVLGAVSLVLLPLFNKSVNIVEG
ncbi:MAG: flippase-like domain-containing protein, partial [Bacteroidales bacterium]|nr:flippase-like domain-containing protein [Bacteroidales bacterium]